MDKQRWSRGARGFPLELAAVAGPVLLTAVWLVLGAVSPGYYLWGTRVAPYSPVSQPISGLGLGQTGPYMNAAFVISGLLVIVACTAYSSASPRCVRGTCARRFWPCPG